MNELSAAEISDRWIRSKRGRKNGVDPYRPYAWLMEKERTASGTIEDTSVIFLTNRECPFHCLMCDLWKNTTDDPVPPGAIPAQIEYALERLPAAKHLKLYNSGSFFDVKAIPEQDHLPIASLVGHFDTVIVESHPSFISEKCLHFHDLLKTKLQVAMGLETVHTDVLRTLNKRMTVVDFQKAVHLLKSNDILSRAFILLRPPFLTEPEGVLWAKKSMDFAFQAGVECCIIIPVRAGNGAMEYLAKQGHFNHPGIQSLEEVLEYGIALHKGRVFADTWDLGLFSKCDGCKEQRTTRIKEMNLRQEVLGRVACDCELNTN